MLNKKSIKLLSGCSAVTLALSLSANVGSAQNNDFNTQETKASNSLEPLQQQEFKREEKIRNLLFGHLILGIFLLHCPAIMAKFALDVVAIAKTLFAGSEDKVAMKSAQYQNFENLFTEESKQSTLTGMNRNEENSLAEQNKKKILSMISDLEKNRVLLKGKETGVYHFFAMDLNKTKENYLRCHEGNTKDYGDELFAGNYDRNGVFFTLGVEDDGVLFKSALFFVPGEFISFDNEDGIKKLEQYIRNTALIKKVLEQIGSLNSVHTNRKLRPVMSLDLASHCAVRLVPRKGDKIFCIYNGKQRKVFDISIVKRDFEAVVQLGPKPGEAFGEYEHYNLLDENELGKLSSLLSSLKYDGETFNRRYAENVFTDLICFYKTINKNGYLINKSSKNPTTLKAELTNESFVVYDELKNENIIELYFSDKDFVKKMDNIKKLMGAHLLDVIGPLHRVLTKYKDVEINIEDEEYKLENYAFSGNTLELILYGKDGKSLIKEYNMSDVKEIEKLDHITNNFKVREKGSKLFKNVTAFSM